jgi:hypothetical protein
MPREKQSEEQPEEERLPGRLKKVKQRKEAWQAFESEAVAFKMRLVRVEEPCDG